MKVIKRALLILLFTLIAAVLVQNLQVLSTPIPFQVLQAEPIQMPVVFWFIVFFGLGFLLCYFFDLKKSFAKRGEKKQMEKEITSLKSEVEKYRNQFLELPQEEPASEKPNEPTA